MNRAFARGDERVRNIADWLVTNLYNKIGIILIAGIAAAITVISFTVDRGEGIRAIIYFLIPAAWGAFGLSALTASRRPSPS